MLPERDEKNPLHSQDKTGDAQSTQSDRDQMRDEMAGEARQVGGGGKK